MGTGWQLYFTRRQWLIVFMGFASGLPLALTASTLTAWLSDAQIDITSIGLFAAIAAPYSLKFLWSPLMDGMNLPFFTRAFGRRRGWILAVQLLLVLAIAAMAFADPGLNPWMTALAGFTIALLSASQDIVIDAYRVETIPQEEQGAAAAMLTLGYRLGMLASGAGALVLADTIGWQFTYLAMAGLMGVGVLTTLFAKEPVSLNEGASIAFDESPPLRSPSEEVVAGAPPRSSLRFSKFWHDHILAPFRDFMTRPLWWQVLLFVLLYKLADAFMGIMFNPFLLDIGFTKTQIGHIVKLYGLLATLIGTFFGGWLVMRIGMFRTLLTCGVAHMFTNLLLVVQAGLGANEHFLILAIVTENSTGGMASAAFLAYLASLCNARYTATQYALLSSLAAMGRTMLSTPSGFVASSLGWQGFFLFSSLLAIPSLLLLIWIHRRQLKNS